MSTPAPPAGPTAADGGRWMSSAPGHYPAQESDQADSAWPGEFPGPGGPAEGLDSGAEGGPGEPGPASGGTASGTDSLVRSSGVMAVGTLASRITGFLRTLVLAYALGVGTLADAYNNANTLPNTVYDLMLGRHPDQRRGAAAGHRGEAGQPTAARVTTSGSFTLATLALGGVTVVATLAAGLLVSLYAHVDHRPRAPADGDLRLLLHPADLLLRDELAGRRDPQRARPVSPRRCGPRCINNIVVIGVAAAVHR